MWNSGVDYENIKEAAFPIPFLLDTLLLPLDEQETSYLADSVRIISFSFKSI